MIGPGDAKIKRAEPASSPRVFKIVYLADTYITGPSSLPEFFLLKIENCQLKEGHLVLLRCSYVLVL